MTSNYQASNENRGDSATRYKFYCKYNIKTSSFSKARNRHFLVLRTKTNFLIKIHDIVDNV